MLESTFSKVAENEPYIRCFLSTFHDIFRRAISKKASGRCFWVGFAQMCVKKSILIQKDDCFQN